MQYAEYKPSSLLQTFVKCIWVLESANAPPTDEFDRILPDGCSELIFHFAAPFEKKENDTIHTQSSSFVYGQLSTCLELRPVSNTFVLGVRFYPYGLSAFSSLPQYYFTDLGVNIEDVFSYSQKDIHEKLSQTKNNEEKISLVNEFLIANLLINKKGFRNHHFSSMQFAVQQLQQTGGIGKINSIATKLNISNRELERRFRKYIGLSPKQLSKTFRFQEVLQKKYLSYNLTDIAHLSGYYDQSHFIRDFKAFSGIQPGGFFKMENQFADFFITG